MKRFAKLLRESRLSNNKTQQNIADDLRYSSSQYLSNAERGTCVPSPKLMAYMIKHLSVPENDVLDAFFQDQKDVIAKKIAKIVKRLKKK